MKKQEAIKRLKEYAQYSYGIYHNGEEDGIAFDMAIKALEQVPKTGHWILSDTQYPEEVTNDNYQYICSECGSGDLHSKTTIVPYCWYCGARMESDTE